MSDQELFDKRDYWQPPDEFEKRRKGDCEDFALWTWRQLLDMGYDARFVGGSAGRYGSGHAWVEYFKDGKWFVLEPLACRAGFTVPGCQFCATDHVFPFHGTARPYDTFRTKIQARRLRGEL